MLFLGLARRKHHEAAAGAAAGLLLPGFSKIMPQVPGKLGACEMFLGVLFFLNWGLWWFLSLPCQGRVFHWCDCSGCPHCAPQLRRCVQVGSGFKDKLSSVFSSKSAFAQALGSTIWSYNYPPTIQWEQKGGRFICYAIRGICQSFLLHTECCCYLYAMCNLLEIL